MDWTIIGLSLVTMGALAAFVSRPWWAPQTTPVGPTPATAPSLAEQREATLTALRDLEFDYEVGKVIDEDYMPLRQALLQDTAMIMAQIEQQTNDLDARIEAEIQAVRGWEIIPASDNAGPCPTCHQLAYPGDRYCRGCGTPLALICPECGQAVSAADRFCVECGFELAVAVAG